MCWYFQAIAVVWVTDVTSRIVGTSLLVPCTCVIVPPLPQDE